MIAQINVANVAANSKPSLKTLLYTNNFSKADMILKNENLDVKINYLEEKSKNRERAITAVFIMMVVSLGLIITVAGLVGI